MMNEHDNSLSRRNFLQVAAATAGTLFVPVASLAQDSDSTTPTAKQIQPGAHAGGSDVLKVGVIGAGGRGTGAAINCIESSPNIQIVAIGDAFADRVAESRKKIAEKFPDALKVTDETAFSGMDNYEKVLKTDCDIVILAAPPGFRPQHLRAAVEAGKHIFMEKPVAVDPIGVRSVIESGDMATQKNLCIVAGTQRRHDPIYIETIKRIQDGAIGDVVSGQAYWCQEGLWVKKKKDEWSDLEWQMRNWLYFDWISGDHIVEQHVHNLDVINWIMGAPPVKALGMGGREVRKGDEYGNIFDHFAVEYEYANGARVTSFCRQTEGAAHRVSEFVMGTKGKADPRGKIEGPKAFEYPEEGEKVNPYVNEHKNLVTSIREGKKINEAKRIAESTLTAILGRMSAYTGQAVSWKWAMNASKLDLTPKKLEFGPNPINPVPVPGVTKLV